MLTSRMVCISFSSAKAIPAVGLVDLQGSGFPNRRIQVCMGRVQRKGTCRRRFGSESGIFECALRPTSVILSSFLEKADPKNLGIGKNAVRPLKERVVCTTATPETGHVLCFLFLSLETGPNFRPEQRYLHNCGHL
jgi:hypothetical protein